MVRKNWLVGGGGWSGVRCGRYDDKPTGCNGFMDVVNCVAHARQKTHHQMNAHAGKAGSAACSQRW